MTSDDKYLTLSEIWPTRICNSCKQLFSVEPEPNFLGSAYCDTCRDNPRL